MTVSGTRTEFPSMGPNRKYILGVWLIFLRYIMVPLTRLRSKGRTEFIWHSVRVQSDCQAYGSTDNQTSAPSFFMSLYCHIYTFRTRSDSALVANMLWIFRTIFTVVGNIGSWRFLVHRRVFAAFSYNHQFLRRELRSISFSIPLVIINFYRNY